MLIPSPRVTDSLTLFLWSCDRCFVLWFAGIPFLFRINMLVATLLIFAVATAGDSAGDISTCCWSGLSESILALVCLSLGVFTALHIYLFALHSMCAFTFLHHILDCLDFYLWVGVSRGKRPNTQAMSDTIGTRNRVAVTDRRRMPD